MNIKKIMYLLILLVVLIVGFVIYVYTKIQTESKIDLSYADIGNVQVMLVKKDGVDYLNIKGQYLKSSSLVIGTISENEIGKAIQVKVTTSLPDEKHKNSSFVYDVKLNENIDKVFLGKDNIEVWTKK